MFNISVIALVISVLFASIAEAQSNDQAYLEFQVHRPVRVKEGGKPMYPQRLQLKKIAGEVIVQFVVNDRGDAELQTLRVVKSSDREFTESVRRAVAGAVFYPAELEGKPVNQLVQLTFKFEPK